MVHVTEFKEGEEDLEFVGGERGCPYDLTSIESDPGQESREDGKGLLLGLGGKIDADEEYLVHEVCNGVLLLPLYFPNLPVDMGLHVGVVQDIDLTLTLTLYELSVFCLLIPIDYVPQYLIQHHLLGVVLSVHLLLIISLFLHILLHFLSFKRSLHVPLQILKHVFLVDVVLLLLGHCVVQFTLLWLYVLSHVVILSWVIGLHQFTVHKNRF